MRRQPIIIEIDEIVLHGFAAYHRQAIGDALQSELNELLGRAPFAASSRRPADRVDGGTFEMQPNAAAGHIGRSLAKSIYRSIS